MSLRDVKFTHSDWLLKLRIASAIHFPAYFWISHEYSLISQQKGTNWCCPSTVLVHTKTTIHLNVSEGWSSYFPALFYSIHFPAYFWISHKYSLISQQKGTNWCCPSTVLVHTKTTIHLNVSEGWSSYFPALFYSIHFPAYFWISHEYSLISQQKGTNWCCPSTVLVHTKTTIHLNVSEGWSSYFPRNFVAQ